MMKIYKIFLVIVLVVVSVSCGERNKEFDAPGLDDSYGKKDYIPGKLTPYLNYISYDDSSQIFFMSLQDYHSSDTYRIRIDFKNDQISASYNNQPFPPAPYQCTKKTGPNCQQFELSDLPFGFNLIKFHKKNIEITELTSGHKIVRTLFKLEIPIFETQKFFYMPRSENDDIGYIPNSIRLNDGEDNLLTSEIYLPGQLPMNATFYDAKCMAVADQPNQSTGVVCQFTEKLTSNVETRSWRLKITN